MIKSTVTAQVNSSPDLIQYLLTDHNMHSVEFVQISPGVYRFTAPFDYDLPMLFQSWLGKLLRARIVP